MNLQHPFDSALARLDTLSNDRVGLVDEFFDPNLSDPRFVIGKNAQSERLSRFIPLAGVIDDGALAGSSWKGLTNFKLLEVPPNAWVVNTSTSISPVSVQRTLYDANIKRVLTLADLLHSQQVRRDFTPDFTVDMQHELTNFYGSWKFLYEHLADQTSKQVLIDIVRFRLTVDPQFMGSYFVNFKNQYLEDFLQLIGESFVDGGGFDGDTTEQFCARFPDYEAVYLFEPCPESLLKAKRRLRGYKHIDFFETGLSDSKQELRFDPKLGSASSVSSEGSTSIRVDSLDNLISGRVTFIKMDLEGWELNALKGAKNIITCQHPKLAISVYHKSSHFREVPELVSGFRPDYKIYLRHYSEGWSETVMFFVPNPC